MTVNIKLTYGQWWRALLGCARATKYKLLVRAQHSKNVCFRTTLCVSWLRSPGWEPRSRQQVALQDGWVKRGISVLLAIEEAGRTGLGFMSLVPDPCEYLGILYIYFLFIYLFWPTNKNTITGYHHRLIKINIMSTPAIKLAFGLWEEAGVLGENPCMQRENPTQKGPS